MRIRHHIFTVCAAVVFTLGISPVFAAPTASSPTLENLMTAYNGESNARAKYLAYAVKADQEGYRRIAQLFRAAADSEGIHVRNHAKAITELGGTPKAEITAPTVRSTRENLQDAVTAEGYESSTMYPQFIARAKTDKAKTAQTSFHYAREVEAHHLALYRQALGNLDAGTAAGDPFSVCQVCGNLVEKVDFTDCPVCGYPASEYRKIP